MNYKVIYEDELTHHGVIGQKWGVRRYQNPDGTLTDEGKIKYSKKLITDSGREYSKNKSFKNTIDTFKKSKKDANDYYKETLLFSDKVSKAKDYYEMKDIAREITSNADVGKKYVEDKRSLEKSIDSFIDSLSSNSTDEIYKNYLKSNDSRKYLKAHYFYGV